eukprot:TRINITY_DN12443_c1_g1_i1.p1 TRINITY_DN12443_c1_g1~~TRINITY_DN12443_c1_g1_i1.p1  ORF type:complete len:361 (+),score=39.97 TRINITY_DN12443_c1_g1_i1:64-1146(+)
MPGQLSIMVKEGDTAAKVLKKVNKGMSLVDAAGDIISESAVFAKKEKLELCKTVKVFDPLNKEAYTLRYGGTTSQVHWTIGLDSYLLRVAGNKRVFLCKKYQARQCRAQGKCNSIHADRETVQLLRKQHPIAADSFQQETSVTVFSKADGECFAVPMSKITPTQAVINTSKGCLCPEYDINCVLKCDKGTACQHIHIDTSYFRFLRSLWRTACCRQRECLDRDGKSVKTKLGDAAILPLFRMQGSDVTYPSVKLAVTRGLKEANDEALKTNCTVLEIVQTSICKPHQRKACKWGVDCNNLHICRNLVSTETHLLDVTAINLFRQSFHQYPVRCSSDEESFLSPLTKAELCSLIKTDESDE